MSDEEEYSDRHAARCDSARAMVGELSHLEQSDPLYIKGMKALDLLLSEWERDVKKFEGKILRGGKDKEPQPNA